LLRHAALPAAVVLDGSIAHLFNESSSVLAAGTGRRRRGDQRTSRQRGSQYSDDVFAEIRAVIGSRGRGYPATPAYGISPADWPTLVEKDTAK